MPPSDTSATDSKGAISLEFSEKYSPEHAEHYLHKHRATLGSRLSHWRDTQVARKALKLAGEPMHVLDLPCGAGRFWPLLAEKAGRSIIAADYSGPMLEVARKAQSPAIVSRITMLQTSAFAIDLPADVVDCVFCMRLMHHVGQREHRMAMLKEFHRVSRATAIVSLWVDGNFKAWRRRRLEAKRAARGRKEKFQNRFIFSRAAIEAEFREAGFQIVGKLDFMPGFSMWRTYVLRKAA